MKTKMMKTFLVLALTVLTATLSGCWRGGGIGDGGGLLGLGILGGGGGGFSGGSGG